MCGKFSHLGGATPAILIRDNQPTPRRCGHHPRQRPRRISPAARLPSHRGCGGIPRSLSVLLLVVTTGLTTFVIPQQPPSPPRPPCNPTRQAPFALVPPRPRHHPPVTDLGLPDRVILQYFSTPNLHSIRCAAGDAGSRSRASRRGFMFCTHAHSSGNRARRPRVRRRSGIRRLRRPPT